MFKILIFAFIGLFLIPQAQVQAQDLFLRQDRNTNAQDDNSRVERNLRTNRVERRSIVRPRDIQQAQPQAQQPAQVRLPLKVGVPLRRQQLGFKEEDLPPALSQQTCSEEELKQYQKMSEEFTMYFDPREVNTRQEAEAINKKVGNINEMMIKNGSLLDFVGSSIRCQNANQAPGSFGILSIEDAMQIEQEVRSQASAIEERQLQDSSSNSRRSRASRIQDQTRR